MWAEIDQEERWLVTAYFDSAGHYARWDLMRLEIWEAAERFEVRLARLEPVWSGWPGSPGLDARVPSA